jgi:hypothetical protein
VNGLLLAHAKSSSLLPISERSHPVTSLFFVPSTSKLASRLTLKVRLIAPIEEMPGRSK